jgi:hypothetical protein
MKKEKKVYKLSKEREKELAEKQKELIERKIAERRKKKLYPKAPN